VERDAAVFIFSYNKFIISSCVIYRSVLETKMGGLIFKIRAVRIIVMFASLMKLNYRLLYLLCCKFCLINYVNLAPYPWDKYSFHIQKPLTAPCLKNLT
jgi:hypothetical protein